MKGQTYTIIVYRGVGKKCRWLRNSGAIVWTYEINLKTAQGELDKLPRLPCFGTAEAMRSYAIPTLGTLLDLSPLHMVAKTKALESYDEGILELRLTTPFLTAANETF